MDINNTDPSITDAPVVDSTPAVKTPMEAPTAPLIDQPQDKNTSPVYKDGQVDVSGMYYSMKKHPDFQWMNDISEAKFKQKMEDPALAKQLYEAIQEHKDLRGSYPADFEQFSAGLKKKDISGLGDAKTDYNAPLNPIEEASYQDWYAKANTGIVKPADAESIDWRSFYKNEVQNPPKEDLSTPEQKLKKYAKPTSRFFTPESVYYDPIKDKDKVFPETDQDGTPKVNGDSPGQFNWSAGWMKGDNFKQVGDQVAQVKQTKGEDEADKFIYDAIRYNQANTLGNIPGQEFIPVQDQASFQHPTGEKFTPVPEGQAAPPPPEKKKKVGLVEDFLNDAANYSLMGKAYLSGADLIKGQTGGSFNVGPAEEHGFGGDILRQVAAMGIDTPLMLAKWFKVGASTLEGVSEFALRKFGIEKALQEPLAKATDRLVQAGVERSIAEKTVLNTASNSLKNVYNTAHALGGSAHSLAMYEGVGALLNKAQQEGIGSLTINDELNSLVNYSHGLAMGGAVGIFGAVTTPWINKIPAGSKVVKKIVDGQEVVEKVPIEKIINVPKLAAQTGQLATEAGIFTVAGSALNGEAPTWKEYESNLGFMVGLRMGKIASGTKDIVGKTLVNEYMKSYDNLTTDAIKNKPTEVIQGQGEAILKNFEDKTWKEGDEVNRINKVQFTPEEITALGLGNGTEDIASTIQANPMAAMDRMKAPTTEVTQVAKQKLAYVMGMQPYPLDQMNANKVIVESVDEGRSMVEIRGTDENGKETVLERSFFNGAGALEKATAEGNSIVDKIQQSQLTKSAFDLLNSDPEIRKRIDATGVIIEEYLKVKNEPASPDRTVKMKEFNQKIKKERDQIALEKVKTEELAKKEAEKKAADELTATQDALTAKMEAEHQAEVDAAVKAGRKPSDKPVSKPEPIPDTREIKRGNNRYTLVGDTFQKIDRANKLSPIDMNGDLHSKLREQWDTEHGPDKKGLDIPEVKPEEVISSVTGKVVPIDQGAIVRSKEGSTGIFLNQTAHKNVGTGMNLFNRKLNQFLPEFITREPGKEPNADPKDTYTELTPKQVNDVYGDLLQSAEQGKISAGSFVHRLLEVKSFLETVDTPKAKEILTKIDQVLPDLRANAEKLKLDTEDYLGDKTTEKLNNVYKQQGQFKNLDLTELKTNDLFTESVNPAIEESTPVVPEVPGKPADVIPEAKPATDVVPAKESVSHRDRVKSEILNLATTTQEGKKITWLESVMGKGKPITEPEVEAGMKILDAHAQVWGKETGKDPDAYFESMKITKNPSMLKNALKQWKLYHGTGTVFAKFSTDKIGTGEGAQAFGWGLYFSNSKGIAKWYADQVGGRDVEIKNGNKDFDPETLDVLTNKERNPFDEYTDLISYLSKLKKTTRGDILDYLKEQKKVSEGTVSGNNYLINQTEIEVKSLARDSGFSETDINDLITNKTQGYGFNKINNDPYFRQLVRELEHYSNRRDLYTKDVEKIQEAHDQLLNLDPDFTVSKTKKVIYDVTVHKGKDPSQYDYLDWATEVSKSQLHKITKRAQAEGSGRMAQSIEETMKSQGRMTGREIYQEVESWMKSPKESSEFLLRAGIDGMQYDAVNGTGGKNKNVKNYVVFSDKEVEIEQYTLLKQQVDAIEGAYQATKDGKHLIGLFKGGNVTSIIHEIAGHRGRRMLYELEQANPEKWATGNREVEAWAGVKDQKWTVPAEEKFSRAMEKYFKDGILPKNAPESLRAAFDMLKEWFGKVYKGVAEIEGIKIPKNIRTTFDKMLGVEPELIKSGKWEKYDIVTDVETGARFTKIDGKLYEVTSDGYTEKTRASGKYAEDISAKWDEAHAGKDQPELNPKQIDLAGSNKRAAGLNKERAAAEKVRLKNIADAEEAAKQRAIQDKAETETKNKKVSKGTSTTKMENGVPTTRTPVTEFDKKTGASLGTYQLYESTLGGKTIKYRENVDLGFVENVDTKEDLGLTITEAKKKVAILLKADAAHIGKQSGAEFDAKDISGNIKKSVDGKELAKVGQVLVGLPDTPETKKLWDAYNSKLGEFNQVKVDRALAIAQGKAIARTEGRRKNEENLQRLGKENKMQKQSKSQDVVIPGYEKGIEGTFTGTDGKTITGKIIASKEFLTDLDQPTGLQKIQVNPGGTKKPEWITVSDVEAEGPVLEKRTISNPLQKAVDEAKSWDDRLKALTKGMPAMDWKAIYDVVLDKYMNKGMSQPEAIRAVQDEVAKSNFYKLLKNGDSHNAIQSGVAAMMLIDLPKKQNETWEQSAKKAKVRKASEQSSIKLKWTNPKTYTLSNFNEYRKHAAFIMMDNWIDDKGNIKNYAIRKAQDATLGKTGVELELAMRDAMDFVYRINALNGSSAKANYYLKGVFDDIYGGAVVPGKEDWIMSKNEQLALSKYMEARRVIELDRVSDEKNEFRIDHTSNYSAVTAQNVLDAMKSGKNNVLMEAEGIDVEGRTIGGKKFGGIDIARIEEAAKKINREYAKILDEFHEEGMIADASYKYMKDTYKDYYPTLFVQHLDQYGSRQGGFGTISGIKAIDMGSTQATVYNSQVLLTDSRVRGFQAIDQNRMMRQFVGYIDEFGPEWAAKGKLTTDSYDYLKRVDAVKAENLAIEKENADTGSNKPLKDLPEFKALQYAEAPHGFSKMSYMDTGIRKEIYVKNEFFNELRPENRKPIPKILTMWTQLVKTFATGLNPEFSVVNLAMDIMHNLLTQRTYDGTARFFGHRTNIMPLEVGSLLKDIASNATDIPVNAAKYLYNKDFLKAGEHIIAEKYHQRVKDYMMNGGGMDFITKIRANDSGNSPHTRTVETFHRALGWLETVGTTSELLTRTSVMERTYKNQLESFKKNFPGKTPTVKEMADMKWRAAQTARNVLDFNQKGSSSRWLDAIFPYFNAGIQVTRVTATSLGLGKSNKVNREDLNFKVLGHDLSIEGKNLLLRAAKNPKMKDFFVVGSKVAQLAGIAVAAVAYNHGNIKTPRQMLGLSTPEEDELRRKWALAYENDISPAEKAGNLIWMTNSHWEDRDGNTHFRYLKIRVDGSMRWAKALAEEVYRAINYDAKFDMPKFKMAAGALLQNAPNLSGTPMNIPFAVIANKDFYFNRPIYFGSENLTPGNRKDEINYDTRNTYIRLGQLTDKSPARMQYVAGRLLTTNNFMVDGAERLFGAFLPKVPELESNRNPVKEDWAKIPFLRRLMGSTRTQKSQIPGNEAEALKAYHLHNSKVLDNMLGNPNVEGGQIVDWIMKDIKPKNPTEYERLLGRIKTYNKSLGADKEISDIAAQPAGVAAASVFHEMLKKPEAERDQYAIDFVDKANKFKGKNIVTQDFQDVWNNLTNFWEMFRVQDPKDRKEIMKNYDPDKYGFISKDLLELMSDDVDAWEKRIKYYGK